MSTSVDGVVDSQIVESKTIRWFLPPGCVVHAVLLGYIHNDTLLTVCVCVSLSARVLIRGRRGFVQTAKSELNDSEQIASSTR